MAISDELRNLVDPNNECCCEHCLSNKCKEWGVAQPLKHNFHISVATHKGSEYSATIAYWSDQLKNESFRGSSEPEAVFKACQWIYNNKDKR